MGCPVAHMVEHAAPYTKKQPKGLCCMSSPSLLDLHLSGHNRHNLTNANDALCLLDV